MAGLGGGGGGGGEGGGGRENTWARMYIGSLNSSSIAAIPACI